MKGALYAVISVVLVIVLVVAIFGTRGHHFTRPPFEVFPDMNYQDKVKDQVASSFFADGVASRAPIPGTVAEEMPAKIDYWASGKWDATHWGDGIPVHEARAGMPALAVDDWNVERGRERYAIDCAVCHGGTGKGDGITSKYGLNGAANYHTDRLRTDSDGDLFNTITNGKGQMMGYGYNVTIDDRWRIVMYIRALQHSENAAIGDASPDEQQKLQSKKPTGSAINFPPFGEPGFAIPPRLINDSGMVEVGKTFYVPFNGTKHSELDRSQTKNRAIAYLDQHTMRGWTDSIMPMPYTEPSPKDSSKGIKEGETP
jgi:mono/diheme cytochrome c family protein